MTSNLSSFLKTIKLVISYSNDIQQKIRENERGNSLNIKLLEVYYVKQSHCQT